MRELVADDIDADGREVEPAGVPGQEVAQGERHRSREQHHAEHPHRWDQHELELPRDDDGHVFVAEHAVVLRRVAVVEHREREAALVHQVPVREPLHQVREHEGAGHRDELGERRARDPTGRHRERHYPHAEGPREVSPG
jgi:hypothetical protein